MASPEVDFINLEQTGLGTGNVPDTRIASDALVLGHVAELAVGIENPTRYTTDGVRILPGRIWPKRDANAALREAELLEAENSNF